MRCSSARADCADVPLARLYPRLNEASTWIQRGAGATACKAKVMNAAEVLVQEKHGGITEAYRRGNPVQCYHCIWYGQTILAQPTYPRRPFWDRVWGPVAGRKQRAAR